MVKVKVHIFDIAPPRSESPTAEALRYGACYQGISQFYLHTHTFIHNRNEPYPHLPSQPHLILIYRPRRDGRRSSPAELRTCNLPIASPAFHQTASSAQWPLPAAHRAMNYKSLWHLAPTSYKWPLQCFLQSANPAAATAQT